MLQKINSNLLVMKQGLKGILIAPSKEALSFRISLLYDIILPGILSYISRMGSSNNYSSIVHEAFDYVNIG